MEEVQKKDERYMRMALEEAQKAYEKGEIPIGAVVVCKDRVISRAHNLTETTLYDVCRSHRVGTDTSHCLWHCRREEGLSLICPKSPPPEGYHHWGHPGGGMPTTDA